MWGYLSLASWVGVFPGSLSPSSGLEKGWRLGERGGGGGGTDSAAPRCRDPRRLSVLCAEVAAASVLRLLAPPPARPLLELVWGR